MSTTYHSLSAQGTEHSRVLSPLGGAQELRVLRETREALDDLLASNCVLCDASIVSIDRPFTTDGEEM